MTRPGLHLSGNHPLARVAAAHCAEHAAPLVGGVACGGCWERAIRDDERFVVEFDLDRETPVEPDLIDTIAVERACAGDPVALTRAELTAAIQKLRTDGWSFAAIAEQLALSDRTVIRECDGVDRGRLRVRMTSEGIAA